MKKQLKDKIITLKSNKQIIKCRKYIKENPLQLILIAGLSGIIVGTSLTLLFNKK